MAAFVRQVSEQFDVPFTFTGAHWKLDLPQRGDFICSLSVGAGATDWWMTIVDVGSGKEIGTECMDYAGVLIGSDEFLIVEKEKDILYFVKEWTSATSVEVTGTSRVLGIAWTKKFSWKHQGVWSPIITWAPGSMRR